MQSHFPIWRDCWLQNSVGRVSTNSWTWSFIYVGSIKHWKFGNMDENTICFSNTCEVSYHYNVSSRLKLSSTNTKLKLMCLTPKLRYFYPKDKISFILKKTNAKVREYKSGSCSWLIKEGFYLLCCSMNEWGTTYVSSSLYMYILTLGLTRGVFPRGWNISTWRFQ